MDEETRTRRKYNRYERRHNALVNDNAQIRLEEDAIEKRDALREEALERARALLRTQLGLSVEGANLLECPRCESVKLYAPYRPDREGEFNWVSLRCRDCERLGKRTEWKQTIRLQKDGHWVALRWDDEQGARYLEAVGSRPVARRRP